MYVCIFHIVDVEERMMLTRRGVKLVWTQEGALGRQSFAAFMITIAVGFVLLHLMVVVGNFVATRLLPGRHLYRRAVEEEVSEGISGGGDGESLIASGFSRASNARFGPDYGALEPRD